ncbi:MAG: hypothetical protein GX861_01025 [Tenericutes bacterium]|jgi:precorrin-3B C17-methyltransferase|nr:hypothetical protein [Mycoplasmatota bacterium]
MKKLYIVGVGSGNYDDLTIKATKILNLSDLIYCDERTFKQLSRYLEKNKIVSNSYTATKERCVNAINSALENKVVSILGSGDTGIYGISSLILEYTEDLIDEINIEIIPGITSAISGASLLGSPLTQDFAVITLSDNLANYEELKAKINSIANANLSIVFYSPQNSTYKNLLLALEILLTYRSSETIVGLAKKIGTNNQKIIITNLGKINLEDIDSHTTIFIGNKKTKLTKNKKMVTPLL